MKNDDTELESLRSEAVGYCNRGDFDKAITIHKNIVTRYKDNDQACSYSYASIGDIYLNLRKLELAEDYLKKALGYDPLSPKYHYLLGFTYSISKQWDKAIKEFEVALRQQPEEAEYLRGLGWATWSAGDKGHGLEYLKRAIGLAPDSVNILTDLAVIYMRNGHLDTAQKYAERAVKADPKSAVAKDVLNATRSFRDGLREVGRLPQKTSSIVYEMKASIKGAKPAIWRRFRVSGNITFYKLHRVLQEVMGWSNYHLYEFRFGELLLGEPDPEFGREIRSARRVKLNEILTREMAKFIYIYDFGDGWEHEVTVERILSTNDKLRHPVCVGGERACPPEDCGGIGGYSDLLKTIHNPAHEQYEEMMEWLGGEFDPKRFDIDEVNRTLKGLR
jgi:tetratricopeptide (TPR) repeat protein